MFFTACFSMIVLSQTILSPSLHAEVFSKDPLILAEEGESLAAWIKMRLHSTDEDDQIQANGNGNLLLFKKGFTYRLVWTGENEILKDFSNQEIRFFKTLLLKNRSRYIGLRQGELPVHKSTLKSVEYKKS